MEDAIKQSCEEENGHAACAARREFLVRAATAAGSLMLGLSVSGTAAVAGEDSSENAEKKPEEFVLKLDVLSALS